MAKYYNVQETATLFGISEDEVKGMLDRRELHGYRDGANWKFKAEEIEAMAKQRQEEKAAAPDESQDAGVLDGDDDVLLSEVALGQSSLGMSGTVIGMNGPAIGAGESDIQLAGSAVVLSDMSTSQTPPAIKPETSDSRGSQFENLELTLEEDDDLTLAASTGSLVSELPTGSSAIDLSGKELEDDDLVLGGSGKGSDVSIGGDSGISLVDPADSGLSLEQPLNLAGHGAVEESLELGEDDLILGEAGGSSPSGKADDDFLLTPLEDAADGDESESGSQVIALDTEADAGGLGAMAGGSMAAMLDEDLSAPSAGLDMGMGAAPLAGGSPLLGPTTGLTDGVPTMQPSFLAEPPYTGWQIAGLATCAVLLFLCGMMMYDNLRNMWSWGGVYSFNSPIMDFVVNLFN